MAHATTEQLINALSTLSALDLMILRKMGASLIGGTSYSEPLDLMHEAINRCLDGRRQWPVQKAPFSVFVGNAMRSIAHAERKQNKKRGPARVNFEEFMEDLQKAATSPSAEDRASEAQQIQLTRKAADDLRKKLDGDDGAQKVLSGLVSGLSPMEMRESFHMDENAFDAALKRVVRRARAARMH